MFGNTDFHIPQQIKETKMLIQKPTKQTNKKRDRERLREKEGRLEAVSTPARLCTLESHRSEFYILPILET